MNVVLIAFHFSPPSNPLCSPPSWLCPGAGLSPSNRPPCLGFGLVQRIGRVAGGVAGGGREERQAHSLLQLLPCWATRLAGSSPQLQLLPSLSQPLCIVPSGWQWLCRVLCGFPSPYLHSHTQPVHTRTHSPLLQLLAPSGSPAASSRTVAMQLLRKGLTLPDTFSS